MKYVREIKVGVLAIVCGALVYIGLYYLKGQNVFSKETHYIGLFSNIGGLTEQAPVYVRGFKVGQVDRIEYDYTQHQAFTILISVHHDILVTDPCEMRLFDDGLLGGKAIELVVPEGAIGDKYVYQEGDTILTSVVPGLMATVQEQLLGKVDSAVSNIDALVANINAQIDDQTLHNTLTNVEQATSSLSASAHDIKKVTSHQLPSIMTNADAVLADAKVVVRDVKQADLPATIARVDLTLDTVQSILTSKEGTLGLLLNDRALYNHIDSTVVSVDSLITDLKKNPKRYVHFSLWGGKDKKKKKADK